MNKEICTNCNEGEVEADIYYVTLDMAIDGGDLNLEGDVYEIVRNVCSCCMGDYQNCVRCTKPKKVLIPGVTG